MTGITNKAISIISAFVLFTGCTTHTLTSPELPVTLPESFDKLIETTPPPLSSNKWWEAFSDPRLNALMEEAFSNNRNLAQAFSRLDQLLAVTRATRAASRPFLNLEAEASRTKQPGISGDTTGNNYTLSVAASYELDLWDKLDSRIKGANYRAEASREEIMSLYLSLSAQLADLYYLTIEQHAQIELTDRTVTSFEDTLQRVERRYKEGLVPPLDVYQARQNLASAKANRPLFEAQLAMAEHALSIILGRYPERGLAGDINTFPDTVPVFPSGLPSEVVANRPDIRAALLRLKASDADIAAAVADRFPSFNLLGSYGTSRVASATGDLSGVFWNILVSIAQPILDGERREAEVDRSKAVFKENLSRYHQTVLDAFREVEDALVKNDTTAHRIARLEERTAAAEASLRLSTDRYLQGLSDYLPVLTSQGLHFDAQSKLLTARRQLISDRISLARALGGVWMETELRKHMTTNQEQGEES
jgi:NodT family efflux transporter outer membrane factor (OMF) lipoprotein